MPIILRSILTKLHFLSRIEVGFKPNMNNLTVVESSSWLGSFYRRLYGESRRGVIADIEDMIDEAIDYINKSDPEFIPLIINRIDNTKKGINALKITYRDDINFVSKLNVISDNIDIQLSKLNNKYL